MEKDLTASLQEIADIITQLNAQMKFAPCIICGEEVHTWACVVPENKKVSLGFGEPKGKNKSRIAFVHSCREHDFADKNNIEIVRNNLSHAASINASKN